MREDVVFVAEVHIGNGESLAVYRNPGNTIFGIDASYIEQEIGPTFDPLTGEEFDADKADKPHRP